MAQVLVRPETAQHLLGQGGENSCSAILVPPFSCFQSLCRSTSENAQISPKLQGIWNIFLPMMETSITTHNGTWKWGTD